MEEKFLMLAGKNVDLAKVDFYLQRAKSSVLNLSNLQESEITGNVNIENIIVDLAIYRYNLTGTEHVRNESYNGIYKVTERENDYCETISKEDFYKWTELIILENYNGDFLRNNINNKKIALFALTLDEELEEGMIIKTETSKYRIKHIPKTYRNSMKISLFLEEV